MPTLQGGVCRALVSIPLIAAALGCFPGEPAVPTSVSAVEQRAVQTPCENGRKLVSRAQSECQTDGFLHVVEDVAYTCPPDGGARTFRVYNEKTEERCNCTK